MSSFWTSGSSPLARGTCYSLRNRCVLWRLIPARAGNIPYPSPNAAERTAHPRSRGEHSGVRANLHYGDGSSPLARGTFVPLDNNIDSARLIPARAGNIEPKIAPLRYGTAHPRSRGEHVTLDHCSPVSGGSSPLARGTWQAQARVWFPVRLIPARAGNITKTSVLFLEVQAHPRSRGEHARVHLQALPNARLIPARAGNIYRRYRADR